MIIILYINSDTIWSRDALWCSQDKKLDLQATIIAESAMQEKFCNA